MHSTENTSYLSLCTFVRTVLVRHCSYDKDLSDLVAFPSVSALPQHAQDLTAAADWLAERLRTAGLQVSTTVRSTGSNHSDAFGEGCIAPGESWLFD